MEPQATIQPQPANEIARRQFAMEKDFHGRLIAASNSAARRKLYAEFYSQFTEFAEQSDPGKRNFGSFSPELMGLLSPFVRGKVVIDFGCGYGFATFDLARCARKVIAVDVATPMIQEIQKQVAEQKVGNVEPVLLGDSPNALDQWIGAVDVVYSNDTVEHLHPVDMDEHLALVRRLLCPGGLYICITPNQVTGPHDVSNKFLPYHSKAEGAHIREYSHRTLSELFLRSGFGKIRTPVTAMGYTRIHSDAAFRLLLVPPRHKFWLESLWFGRAKMHRAKLLNLFCLNKVILFAWKK